MRILSATVSNFGSYEKLEFDFTNQGLTLISGATGSGKSTLCDVIPWILFGVTAKNGPVDEVRSWSSMTPTTGRILIQKDSHNILGIVRSRGGAKDNDLWLRVTGPYAAIQDTQRGKDLADTQKLINQELGITAEAYLAGAYFHEFSQTANFFQASAKTRRQLTEQIVDLSLAKTLNENMSLRRKELTKDKNEFLGSLTVQKQLIAATEHDIQIGNRDVIHWEESRALKLGRLKEDSDNFDAHKKKTLQAIHKAYINKSVELQADAIAVEEELKPDGYFELTKKKINEKIKALGDTRCEACGALKNTDKRMILEKSLYQIDNEISVNNQKRIHLTRVNNSLEKHLTTLEPLIKAEEERVNTYDEQIKALKTEKNPHTASVKRLKLKLSDYEEEDKLLQSCFNDTAQEVADIETLLDVTADFRSICVKRTIVYLETQTNKLLSDHFDAEIKVKFSTAAADKLDIEIYKDGNVCSYSQLSKGQRQLLKLTFGVAVMRSVQNYNNVKFSAIFLDEVFDGLDEQLKLKGFGLLEQLGLEYESVFAIDHNDAVKSMFTKRYEVALVDGKSQIDEA